MLQPAIATDVYLHSIEQIQEMVRAREANALTLFLGVAAVNVAAAAWIAAGERWRGPAFKYVFRWLIMTNLLVAVGYAATGYEYYEWRTQLLELAERVPGLVLPTGFFHIGMAAAYVLVAVVLAFAWIRGWQLSQRPAASNSG